MQRRRDKMTLRQAVSELDEEQGRQDDKMTSHFFAAPSIPQGRLRALRESSSLDP